MTLENIQPNRAIDLYLDARANELAQTTLREYRYRLEHFAKWAYQNDIEFLSDLSAHHIIDYKSWREGDGSRTRKAITIESDLDALRIFLRWCETINAVETDLHETVDTLKPTLNRSQEQADRILDAEDAKRLNEYQRKFDYASRRHVIVELLWHSGIRLGALIGLDVDDFDEAADRISLNHRPETETPLKNDKRGERLISLSSTTAAVVADYIEHNRHDVTDDHGRRPLITTRNGRIDSSTVRHIIYEVTQPCYTGAPCPDDRDPDECEATDYEYYHRCPFNVSPHDIRRGSITHFLRSDVPEPVVSDRMNVSREVLDKHYDKRTEEDKVEQRRQYLDNV